jgi:hypothetical protein
LWADVVDRFELDEAESVLLHEAARTADVLDVLAAEVRQLGPMAGDRLHPAVVEAREQRLCLARLIAALRLPEDEPDAGRPQRRGGPRGVYAVGTS